MTGSLEFSYDMYPWKNEDKFFEYDGATICYRTYGNPEHPAVFMIMGLTAAGTFWSPDFCDTIAREGYYVITPDNRDTGKSTTYEKWKGSTNVAVAFVKAVLGKKVSAPFHLEDVADGYHALIQKLGLGKVHLVGTSYGGMISQVYASKYPETIQSLTLHSTCLGNLKDVLPAPSYVLTAELQQLLCMRFYDPKIRAKKYLESLTHVLDGAKKWRDVEDVKKLIDFNVERNRVQNVVNRQMITVIASLPFPGVAKNSTIPTLILEGRRDKVFSPRVVTRLAESIPLSTFVYIEDMGHIIMPSLFQTFIGHLLTHFKKNS